MNGVQQAADVSGFSDALGRLLGLVVEHEMLGVTVLERLTAVDDVNKQWPRVAALLADPTPTLTPEQAAVIEAATAWAAAGSTAPKHWRQSLSARLVAAVDRLAATTKEPT